MGSGLLVRLPYHQGPGVTGCGYWCIGKTVIGYKHLVGTHSVLKSVSLVAKCVPFSTHYALYLPKRLALEFLLAPLGRSGLVVAFPDLLCNTEPFAIQCHLSEFFRSIPGAESQ